ncbi:hypothetical protein CPB85DRAFT_1281224, partial [Mucidula mucida]
MTITPFNATVGEDAEPLLFIPRKGRKYRNGDFKHVCKQQPLPMHELPRYLTDTTVFPSWDAPTLWLGWIISSEDLLKIVEAHYPDSLMYSAGRPCLSSIHALPQSLRDEYHIEPELHECVDIAIVARPDAKRTTALSVGCSNVGVISLQTIEDIQNKFGLQRSPEWLLDGRDWQWTRRTYTVYDPVDPRERTVYTL